MEFENSTKIKIKKIIIFWSIIALILVFVLIGIVFINQPVKATLVVDKIDGKAEVDTSLEIKFDWPVLRQINFSIEPKVISDMIYADMMIGDQLARKIVFRPTLNWAPDTTYTVKISGVKNALPNFLKPREYIFQFTTESVPEIKSIIPEQEEPIRANSIFEITLDKANEGLAEYEFYFEPSISYKTSLSKDKKIYKLSPETLLSQGQKYDFEIKRKKVRSLYKGNEIVYQEEPETVFNSSFEVRETPYIKEFSPKGKNVALDKAIQVTFNEAINYDSFVEKTSIEPAIITDWQTEDNKNFIFKPKTLSKGTTYSINIASGVITEAGGYLEEDSTHRFTTQGPVKLLNSSPIDDASGVVVTTAIEIKFDQSVDHTSAENLFEVLPQVSGNFSWQENAMIFKPQTPLAFNSSYQVVLKPGIIGEFGFDSEKEISFSFSTEVSETKLLVSFHRQEHTLSCEVATLVMALSYRGIEVSENELIDLIGFDPTPKKGKVWGNPHIAFVGNIDGKQPQTGYGVYWQPIAKAAQNYRPSRWFTGWDLYDLINEIKKGNPVIVWGTAGSGTRIDWQTPSGGNVVAINGEHTFLVIGYVGSAEDPKKIIVLDPLSGERHYSIDAFMWNWGLLNRSGVVVD